MSSNTLVGLVFKGAEFGGARPYGVAPEGMTTTSAGGIATLTGDAAVRQSIIMLLTTLPGERVMRPDYGCPLHRLMFEPNDATTAGLAIHYVRESLIKFEPRIEIVALDAHAGSDIAGDDSEDSRLHVSLTYRIRATSRLANLDFSLDLEREGI